MTCSICGKMKGVGPFQYPPDNQWDAKNRAHTGCVRRKLVDNAAKEGFGIDPAKDGPNARESLEFVPSSQETDDGESGEGEPQGPDPDLQAG